MIFENRLTPTAVEMARGSATILTAGSVASGHPLVDTSCNPTYPTNLCFGFGSTHL
jgi:hypothetical protein